jgi:hypothetical protein
MYVYYPAFGWRWVAAPWNYGWGPSPSWGPWGRSHFVWYSRPWFGRWGFGGHVYHGHRRR